MKKNLLLGILLLPTLFLNAQRNSNCDFTLTKSVRLAYNDNGMPFLTHDKSQYVVVNGRETMIVGTMSNRLLFYDLNNAELYHEIQLSESLDYTFHFISRDSIFIVSSSEAGRILRLDINGRLQQAYDFQKQNDNPQFVGSAIQVHNNTCMTALGGPSALIGTSKFMRSIPPSVGLMDLKRETITPSKALSYPEITAGDFYPNNIPLLYHCVGINGNPLVRYFYSNNLYEWSRANDTYAKHALPSQLIADVPPCAEPVSQSDFTLPYHYGPISCDTLRGFYYSQVLFNANFYGDNVWSLIVADKDFNILCEKLNPPFSGTLHFSYDYIIALNNHGEGFIEYGFYKLTPSSISLTEEIERAKDELSKLKKELPATNRMESRP
jgi:hypothetical protein